MRPKAIILIACIKVYPRRLKTPMKNVYRPYSCHWCHKMVIICHACDRGNTYCGKTCSQLSRRALRRIADIKYQKKQQSKLKHAGRQKRYRIRCKKIVTDHSSKPLSTHDLLPPIIDKPRSNPEENNLITSNDRCHFCGSTLDKRAYDGTD